MGREDIGLAYPVVGEKAVGGFGIDPVLSRPRRCCADAAGKLLQQLSQSFAVPNILEKAACYFVLNPVSCVCSVGLALTRGQNPLVFSHGIHLAMNRQSS